MIELLHLIFRLAAYLDPQALIELGVLLGENDGEVGVTAPQIVQLLQHPLRQGVGDSGDGQGDEHLVGVQAGIVVTQVTELHVADGGDDGGREQIQVLVDARQELHGVKKHGRRGPQEGTGLAGDDTAIGQHHGSGRGAGGLGLIQRGPDRRADVRGDTGLLHNDLQLAHHALVALASDPVHQTRIVAAKDLHAAGLLAGGIVHNGKARHIHAHVRGGFIG